MQTLLFVFVLGFGCIGVKGLHCRSLLHSQCSQWNRFDVAIHRRHKQLAMKTIIPVTKDDQEEEIDNEVFLFGDNFNQVAKFLFKAGLIGTLTGISVVAFKTAISSTQYLFYEQLADILPKPSFYWPLALCKSCFSFCLTF